MAGINPINPLIPLQVRGVDAGATFSNVLSNIGRMDQIRQSRQQAPMRQQLLEAQAATAKSAVPTVQDLRFESVVNAAVELNRFPTVEGKLAFAKRRRAELIESGKTSGDPVNTEDTDLYVSKLESGDSVGAQALIDNTISAGQRLGIVSAATGSTGLASAKTEILESGATIQALPSGETIVRNPSGQIVQGEARLAAIKEAQAQVQEKRQRESDVTVSTAKRVAQVQKATKTADKAFGMVESLRANISNLKEVIPLVGEGANTGPIVSIFPSIKAATVKLENLQKRLSLDVVGAVTFGALSKGELDLAKAVAIPLGLEGDELIKWTNSTIAAKEKLANYFEDQAIFLGQGNTQADWLKHKKAELKSSIGDASESDIRQTMKANNMTRPQVIEELKRRRISGGA